MAIPITGLYKYEIKNSFFLANPTIAIKSCSIKSKLNINKHVRIVITISVPLGLVLVKYVVGPLIMQFQPQIPPNIWFIFSIIGDSRL